MILALVHASQQDSGGAFCGVHTLPQPELRSSRNRPTEADVHEQDGSEDKQDAVRTKARCVLRIWDCTRV